MPSVDERSLLFDKMTQVGCDKGKMDKERPAMAFLRDQTGHGLCHYIMLVWHSEQKARVKKNRKEKAKNTQNDQQCEKVDITSHAILMLPMTQIWRKVEFALLSSIQPHSCFGNVPTQNGKHFVFVHYEKKDGKRKKICLVINHDSKTPRLTKSLGNA